MADPRFDHTVTDFLDRAYDLRRAWDGMHSRSAVAPDGYEHVWIVTFPRYESLLAANTNELGGALTVIPDEESKEIVVRMWGTRVEPRRPESDEDDGLILGFREST